MSVTLWSICRHVICSCKRFVKKLFSKQYNLHIDSYIKLNKASIKLCCYSQPGALWVYWADEEQPGCIQGLLWGIIFEKNFSKIPPGPSLPRGTRDYIWHCAIGTVLPFCNWSLVAGTRHGNTVCLLCLSRSRFYVYVHPLYVPYLLYHCPLNKYNIDRGGGEAKKEAACRNEDS